MHRMTQRPNTKRSPKRAQLRLGTSERTVQRTRVTTSKLERTKLSFRRAASTYEKGIPKGHSGGRDDLETHSRMGRVDVILYMYYKETHAAATR